MIRQQVKHSFFVLIPLMILGLSGVAHAQKSKRTTVNFEDQLIKGQNQKPDVLTIFQRKQLNHKRLIRLRENFLPEMRATGNGIDERVKPRLKRRAKKKE